MQFCHPDCSLSARCCVTGLRFKALILWHTAKSLKGPGAKASSPLVRPSTTYVRRSPHMTFAHHQEGLRGLLGKCVAIGSR